VWDKQGNLVGVEGLIGPPGSETVGHMRRLVMMYLEELLKLRESDGIDVSDISSWDSGTVGNASDRLIVSGRIEIEV
jgi:hypothetical protein